MAGIKDKITGAMEDGSLLTLGLVALVAVAGEVNQRRGGGSASFFGSSNDNGEDDLWWQEGGFYDEGSMSHGSRAMSYTDFVADRIPKLTAKGHSAKQAMSMAAGQWRNR